GCGPETICPFTALPCRLLVDVPSQCAEKRIFDDLLVKRGILSAATLPRILDKEFALGNAGCAECVGLDNVRPGFEKAAMNVADHLWLGQREEVTVVKQAFRGVLEAVPTDVRFGHAIRADGRAHRSVDDGNTIFEDLFQRMCVEFSHVS